MSEKSDYFNSTILENVRKEYHKFWYNQFRKLKLTGSYPNILKAYTEFNSRKHFQSDIQELIEKGEIN